MMGTVHYVGRLRICKLMMVGGMMWSLRGEVRALSIVHN